MIAAGMGEDGGKDELPKLAGLAEQVIRLPERTAAERAWPVASRRTPSGTALPAISDLYGLGLNVDAIKDADLERRLSR